MPVISISVVALSAVNGTDTVAPGVCNFIVPADVIWPPAKLIPWPPFDPNTNEFIADVHEAFRVSDDPHAAPPLDAHEKLQPETGAESHLSHASCQLLPVPGAYAHATPRHQPQLGSE